METKTMLLCDLLECGYSDIDYLVNLLDKNNIEIDLQDLKANYGVLNFNWIVYDIMTQIAEKFIEDNQEKIEKILDLGDSTIYDYMNYHEIYEIFTNYIDSHIWFNDEKIQELFEKSEYWT